MAASVSNIVRASPLTASITLAAVATGTSAFQDQATTDLGIDGNGCLTLANQTAGWGSADIFSAHGAFSGGPYDLSSADQSFIVHFKNIGGAGFNAMTATADGFQVLFFSGSSTANWAAYYFDPRSPSLLLNTDFHALICNGTPDATGGSWDNTDITDYGFAYSADPGIAYEVWISVDQMLYIDGPVVFDDTNTDQVGSADYAALFDPAAAGTYHNNAVISAGTTYEWPFPVDIQARNYEDLTVTSGFAFKGNDTGFGGALTDYYSLLLTGQAAGTQLYENFAVYSGSADFDLTIDGSAATTDITIDSGNLSSLDDVVISGAGTTITNTTFVSPESFDIADADLSITVTDVTAAIQWTGDLVASSSITTNSDVDITFDVGDYSNIVWTFTANNNATVTPTTDAGTYTLSSWVNTGFTTDFDIPSGNTNDTTIALAAAFTGTRTDPTTGGGEITLSLPATSYTLQLPNIIDDSRFQVFNVTTGTELTNSTTSGGTGIDETYTQGTDYSTSDVGRYRVTYQSGVGAKETISGTFTFPGATATNSIPTTQANQASYVSHATDGSAVTGISWDSGNLQFDFNETDDVVDGQDIGSWYYYFITTAVGIDEAFDAFFWPKVNELTNVTANVSVTFDNVSTDPLQIINCWLKRDDDATIIAATSNSIQIDPPAVFSVDDVFTSPSPEPTSVPAANAAPRDKLSFMYASMRNKGTQTTTTKTIRNDSDTADIGTAAVSNDGTTFTKQEYL